jgi:hypothetical protein
MIVDRDTLLIDYSNAAYSDKSCSPVLVYSICALGALMSSDPKVRETADHFSVLAQDSLSAQGPWVPEMSSVQALLCCAFYEVGRGNASKGWMYSGTLKTI